MPGMTTSIRETSSPGVVSVTFSHRNTRLTVELDDGRIISAPIAWYPRLQYGTARERGFWRIAGSGGGIHWPDLDEDISVENLLEGKRSLESERSLRKWLEGRSPKVKRSHKSPNHND